MYISIAPGDKGGLFWQASSKKETPFYLVGFWQEKYGMGNLSRRVEGREKLRKVVCGIHPKVPFKGAVCGALVN